MDRPEQPTEYPGNLTEGDPTPPPVAPTGPQPLRREYLHPLTGAPLTGVVRVFKDGTMLASIGVLSGVLELKLQPGRYLLTVELDVDGVTRYQDEVVNL